MNTRVRIGIIGGGLMGREVASALGVGSCWKISQSGLS